jgi:hypothetical protein
MDKFSKMKRFVPSIYSPEYNTNVKGLLYAWSQEDDIIIQQIQNAKEQLFVQTAQVQFLDSLGSNVGVYRPVAVNLADDAYRKLIPLLSFHPKQVIPTIRKVLEVFFGVGHPLVFCVEINPNEVTIQIPSSVPALRRTLRGSHHFHAYNGDIVSVDNVLKEMVVNFNNPTKVLSVDELADNGWIGQGLSSELIISNTAGNSGVVLQFNASADLSVFNTSDKFNIVLRNYPGSFMPNPNSQFTVTHQRGILGQVINIGDIIPVLIMSEASRIPDGDGHLSFSFGRDNEESLVRYFGRPNNSTLLLDPSYAFIKGHLIGEVVNYIVKPYMIPRISGEDYSIYLVGVTAARILCQQIIQSIVAAGVVIRWLVIEPICTF